MKIPQKTITVTLSDPEGDAKLTFERLRENEKAQFLASLAALTEAIEKKAASADDKLGQFTGLQLEAELSRHKQAILKNCLSVSNLFEGDRAVTVEDVRRGNLYGDVVDLIVRGFNGLLNPEAEEKNEGSGVDASSASETGSLNFPTSTVTTATTSK